MHDHTRLSEIIVSLYLCTVAKLPNLRRTRCDAHTVLFTSRQHFSVAHKLDITCAHAMQRWMGSGLGEITPGPQLSAAWGAWQIVIAIVTHAKCQVPRKNNRHAVRLHFSCPLLSDSRLSTPLLYRCSAHITLRHTDNLTTW
jgi:hypothetical protein